MHNDRSFDRFCYSSLCSVVFGDRMAGGLRSSGGSFAIGVLGFAIGWLQRGFAMAAWDWAIRWRGIGSGEARESLFISLTR
jgi:hypothetical protein